MNTKTQLPPLPMVSDRYVIDVDLDGVCSDYVAGLRRALHELRGVDPESLPEPVDYNLSRVPGWPFANTREYLDFHAEAVGNGLFRDLPVMDGAVDALKELDEDRFYIRVVTHRLITSGRHAQVVTDTAEWLEKHEIPYMSLCFAGLKDSIKASLHIEDAPGVIESFADEQEPVLIFDQPYNRHVGGSRASTWVDVLNQIRQATS